MTLSAALSNPGGVYLGTTEARDAVEGLTANAAPGASAPLAFDEERLQVRVGMRGWRLEGSYTALRAHSWRELETDGAFEVQSAEDGRFHLVRKHVYLFEIFGLLPWTFARRIELAAHLPAWCLNIRCRLVWIGEGESIRAYLEIVPLSYDVVVLRGDAVAELRLRAIDANVGAAGQTTDLRAEISARSDCELVMESGGGTHSPYSVDERSNNWFAQGWQPAERTADGFVLKPGRIYSVPISPWAADSSDRCYTIVPFDGAGQTWQTWRSLFVPNYACSSRRPIRRLLLNGHDIPYVIFDRQIVGTTVASPLIGEPVASAGSSATESGSWSELQ